MMASELAVDIDVGVVVDGTKIKQRAMISIAMPVKRTLKPYGTLVEEQPVVLRIPVARNLHGRRFVEVVFYQVFRALRLGIEEEAPGCGIHAVVVVALFLHIDDIVPLTIE